MWVRFTLDEFKTVAHYIGTLIVGVGVAMVVPLVTALIFGEWEPAVDYVIGIGVAGIVGFALMAADPKARGVNARQALVITALSWLLASLVAAVPLSLSPNYMSYLDALFDALSGLTTSGLTLVVDIDHMASAHLMWRQFLHLLGGQGIIVAALSFAFGTRAGSFTLYTAEGRDERILPNVMHTARFIWFVTAVYVVLGTIALGAVMHWLGIDVIRAALEGFWMTVAAFDTGGFAPHSQNALFYHSGAVEIALMVLMLAGTMNFALHADVWRGDFRELGTNIETRALAINMAILTVFVTAGLVLGGALSEPSEVLRKGLFHVVSAHSGTGHQTLYGPQWSLSFGGVATMAVILAMGAGGAVSSTAGGVKALRLAVIAKSLLLNVRKQLAPESAVVRDRFHHLKDRPMTDALVSAAMTVAVLYAFTYITGGIIGAAYGFPIESAMFESVSAAANVGLSTGITSPAMPGGLKILYILQMWAGRLEFIALLSLFAAIVISMAPWPRGSR
jgi:trk system potassium uptake protein TrkH